MNRCFAIGASLVLFAFGCSGAATDVGPASDMGGSADTDRAEDAATVDGGRTDDAGDSASHGDIGEPEAPSASEAGLPLTDGSDINPDAASIGNNPPIPDGWQVMRQAEVTPEITAWAVTILHDPSTYPMFSSTMQMFGTLLVLARVEWHPPDFQDELVHRGVTLYEPI